MNWTLSLAAWAAHAWWSSILLLLVVAGIVIADLVLVKKAEDASVWVVIGVVLLGVVLAVNETFARTIINTLLLQGIAPSAAGHMLAVLAERRLEKTEYDRHFRDGAGWWVWGIPPVIMTAGFLIRWLAPAGGWAARAAAGEWVIGFILLVPATTAGLCLLFWKERDCHRRLLFWEAFESTDSKGFRGRLLIPHVVLAILHERLARYGDKRWKLFVPYVSVATLAWMLGPTLWPLPWLSWYGAILAVVLGIPAALRGLVILWYRLFPLRHPSSTIRCKAVAGIEQQNRLVKIARNNRYDEVRKAALGRISDPQVLAEVARTDKTAELRKAAVERITDQEVLTQIVKNDGDVDVRQTAFAKVAAPQILAHVARTDRHSRLRLQALGRLDDPAVFSEVAQSDSEATVRKAAVDRISDEGILARVAGSDHDTGVREAAVARITDQKLLLDLAKIVSSREVYRVALERIADGVALLDIAQSAKQPEVRREAAERIVKRGLADDLRAVLQCQDPATFATVAIPLIKRGDNASVEALLAATNTQIRLAAADALGRHGHAAGLQVLLAALQSKDGSERHTAAYAIQALMTKNRDVQIDEAMQKVVTRLTYSDHSDHHDHIDSSWECRD